MGWVVAGMQDDPPLNVLKLRAHKVLWKDWDVCGMALHYTKTLIVTDHWAKNYIPEFGPVFLWMILGNALHWTTVDCSALGRSDILLVQRYRGLMGIVLRSFSFFESSFSMVRSPFSMVKYYLKSALVWSISPDFSFFFQIQCWGRASRQANAWWSHWKLLAERARTAMGL